MKTFYVIFNKLNKNYFAHHSGFADMWTKDIDSAMYDGKEKMEQILADYLSCHYRINKDNYSVIEM